MNSCLSRISHATPIILAAIALNACAAIERAPSYIEDSLRCPVIDYHSLDWSPDGSQIVYSGTHMVNNQLIYDMFILDVATGKSTVLPHTRDVTRPTWSPDGKRIAFIDRRGGTRRAIVIDVASGEVTTLSTADNNYPSWSPWLGEGGDSSAVATSILYGGKEVLALIPVEGTASQALNGLEGNYPDWSPDGGRIVYVSDFDVYITPVDRIDPEQVTENGNFNEPAWSPDGTRIALVSLDSNLLPHIEVLELATGNITPLVDGTSPSWSPDGKRLAFSSFGSRDTGIFTIDLGSKVLTRLTHDARNDVCFYPPPLW